MIETAEIILTLLETPGIGRGTAWHAMAWSDKLNEFPGDYVEVLQRIKGFHPHVRVPTMDELIKSHDRATMLLLESAAHHIRPVCFLDPEFPQQLMGIPDPPLLVFIRGDINCVRNVPGVAVVGTRQPTEYGVRCAEGIGRGLALLGATVVSGLAEGCDTAAHRGCLKAYGKTVAVLAHGLDSVYPSRNAALADQILQSGGLLLSEYPVFTPASRPQFVDRDRLQSGLCGGVIVIETDIKGGTMHTVRFANKQDRAIGCLRYKPDMPVVHQCQGNRMLLESPKIYPIDSKDDLPGFLRQCRVGFSTPFEPPLVPEDPDHPSDE